MIPVDDRERDEELKEQEGEKSFAGLGEEPREGSAAEPDEETFAAPDEESSVESSEESSEGRFGVPVVDSSEPAYADTEEPAHAEESPYTEEFAGTEEPAYAQESPYAEELADTEEPPYAEAPVSAEESAYSESDEHTAEPLLASASAEAFRGRWSDVQVAFIEDPHRSVAEADSLLSEILTAYQEAVEQRRAQISADSTENSADTEHLRLALLDYRTIITAMLPAHSS